VVNLVEELGGDHGRSHNDLYRDFMAAVDAPPEHELAEPAFATWFNESWSAFVAQRPARAGVVAMALYEALDPPDYGMLDTAISTWHLPVEAQRFFSVHAKAHAHYELFEEALASLASTEPVDWSIDEVEDFIIKTQEKMWHGLMEYIEAGAGSSS
jgi:hypothetical protein